MPNVRMLQLTHLLTAFVAGGSWVAGNASASPVTLTFMVGSAYESDLKPWPVFNGNYYEFQPYGADQRFITFTLNDSPVRTEISAGSHAPTVKTFYSIDLESIQSDFSRYLPGPAGFADASELAPTWAEATLAAVYPSGDPGGLLQFSFGALWRSEGWSYSLGLTASAPMWQVSSNELNDPIAFLNPYDGLRRRLFGSETSGSVANGSYTGGERWTFNHAYLWSKEPIEQSALPLPSALALLFVGLPFLRLRGAVKY